MTHFIQTSFAYLRTHFFSVTTAANNVVTNTSTSVGIQIPTGPGRAGSNLYANWGSYVSDIYLFAKYIGVTLATIMILYSAILYLTSQGDSSKINTAKEFMMGALIGLAMLFMLNYIATLLNIQGITTPTK